MSDNRSPHAVLDIPSRLLKGKKIEMLLGLPASQQQLRMLEIGTGSGGIASYFSAHAEQAFAVDAVDVVDSRLTTDGYNFHIVQGTDLPFADASFDVVITNHVIEHVGDYHEQIKHLREVVRVLKPDGVGYLAVPNRWMLVEPHYQLIFLSWLPKSWRSPYLKRMRNVAFYDCEPLEMYELETMLKDCQLTYDNRCIAAMELMQSLEGSSSLLLKICNRLPAFVLRRLVGIIPTLIYTFRKTPV